MPRRRGWRQAGCYVWRTRKPYAIVGLSLRWLLLAGLVIGLYLYFTGGWWWLALLAPFFSGRHTAYVGETGNRFFRDQQHIKGSYRYATPGKPWSDLDPKCYPLPCLFPWLEPSRKILEKLYIWILWPVYNVEWNTKNPRRIKPGKAEQQRWARDGRKLRYAVPKYARAALALVIFAGLTYTGWDKWMA